MIYGIYDQLVEPFREIGDMEPRVTGNHGTTKRREKRRDQEGRCELAFRAANP